MLVLLNPSQGLPQATREHIHRLLGNSEAHPHIWENKWFANQLFRESNVIRAQERILGMLTAQDRILPLSELRPDIPPDPCQQLQHILYVDGRPLEVVSLMKISERLN
jgi:hypothetical protein